MLSPGSRSLRGSPQHRQRGMFLLEALVGILIFSIGILALVAMQATAITAQADAQYRVEAANRAEQIASEIALNVDRTSATTIQTSLAPFAHQASGTNCSFSGAASTVQQVTDWVGTVTTGRTRLPGTSASKLKVAIDSSAAAYNKVSVTICWQAPNDLVARRHTVVTFIN